LMSARSSGACVIEQKLRDSGGASGGRGMQGSVPHGVGGARIGICTLVEQQAGSVNALNSGREHCQRGIGFDQRCDRALIARPNGLEELLHAPYAAGAKTSSALATSHAR
jgi:hypothetical protein